MMQEIHSVGFLRLQLQTLPWGRTRHASGEPVRVLNASVQVPFISGGAEFLAEGLLSAYLT